MKKDEVIVFLFFAGLVVGIGLGRYWNNKSGSRFYTGKEAAILSERITYNNDMIQKLRSQASRNEINAETALNRTETVFSSVDPGLFKHIEITFRDGTVKSYDNATFWADYRDQVSIYYEWEKSIHFPAKSIKHIKLESKE